MLSHVDLQPSLQQEQTNMHPMYIFTLLLHFIVARAFPISDNEGLENEETDEVNGRALDENNAYKRQFGYDGPSMDEFDEYGHHIHSHGHMSHPGINTGAGYGGMDGHVAHTPYIVHPHEYQFHAPDIDYWWPHHWPHHLPPPFPFHKKEDDKKKDKDKKKEKDKKKGNKTRR